jgi:hypothetical protein
MGTDILSYLAEQTGMNVKIISESTDFEAKVENNTIIINKTPEMSTNDIVKKGIHEFSHIALAYLKSTD